MGVDQEVQQLYYTIGKVQAAITNFDGQIDALMQQVDNGLRSFDYQVYQFISARLNAL